MAIKRFTIGILTIALWGTVLRAATAQSETDGDQPVKSETPDSNSPIPNTFSSPAVSDRPTAIPADMQLPLPTPASKPNTSQVVGEGYPVDVDQKRIEDSLKGGPSYAASDRTAGSEYVATSAARMNKILGENNSDAVPAESQEGAETPAASNSIAATSNGGNLCKVYEGCANQRKGQFSEASQPESKVVAVQQFSN